LNRIHCNPDLLIRKMEFFLKGNEINLTWSLKLLFCITEFLDVLL
jgi:hypothetical protein